jgi:hypothetical protein
VLYEHNFDPEPLDSKNGMRVAIRQFQEKTNMTPTGEATEGVLTRLRKMAPAAFTAATAPEPSADRTAAAGPGRRQNNNVWACFLCSQMGPASPN